MGCGKGVGRLPIVKDLFRKLRHLPWVSLRVEYGNSIF